MAAATLGLNIKIPQKKFDDVIFDHIRANPELLSRYAEDVVDKRIRKGRTDPEIAREVLELALQMAEYLVKGRWPEVVKDTIASGELRRTVEAVGTALAGGLQSSTMPEPKPFSNIIHPRPRDTKDFLHGLTPEKVVEIIRSNPPPKLPPDGPPRPNDGSKKEEAAGRADQTSGGEPKKEADDQITH